MILTSQPASLSGAVDMPASKSHTIRALIIATLASGTSVIRKPLASSDTEAALRVCQALGARIEAREDWLITGVSGAPATPDDVLDVGNSGTTLYVALATAALGSGYTVFTGDEQIRRRPAGPLLASLEDLGAEAYATRGNGCAPIVVHGPMRGGQTVIECQTSQYLSALLLNCPLASDDTEIVVPVLNERPYVQMTVDWLDAQRIAYRSSGLTRFSIRGGQSYQAFEGRIAADFSSATFFLVAAALGQEEVLIGGLDMTDTQGDKAVVDMLRSMGARIEVAENGLLVRGGGLHGAVLDLNDTPDALPALAVAGCLAEGETRLMNVAQARLKETDRIAVMAAELARMGADIQEQPDGLLIRQSRLQGVSVDGHGDHRVVMSLAVAGLHAEGETSISTAEAIAVTFPNFVELMNGLGAQMTLA